MKTIMLSVLMLSMLVSTGSWATDAGSFSEWQGAHPHVQAEIGDLKSKTATLVKQYGEAHHRVLDQAVAPSPASVYADLARTSSQQSGGVRRQVAEQLDESRDLWMVGDCAAAKLGFMATLKLDPANAEANFYLGDCLVRDGNKSGAAEYLLRAQHFAKEGPIAWRATAALYALPAPPPQAPEDAFDTPVQFSVPGAIASIRDCAECPEVTVIPAGEYTMGSPLTETGRTDEESQHRVRIDYALGVGTYPVTREQYAAFVRETARADEPACFMMSGATSRPAETTGRNWHEVGFAQSPSNPVVCVTADDAQAYVDWLSQKTGQRYRLLSESEFEFAARAGTTTAFWWGDGIGTARARCAGCGNRPGMPTPPPGAAPNAQPVAGAPSPPAAPSGAPARGSPPPGSASAPDAAAPMGPPFQITGTVAVGQFAANPFGLFDVNGNVYEWIADCYHDSYRGAPADGSPWLDTGGCAHHMVRGGSWINSGDQLRSAYRFVIMSPNTAHNHVGFRVAREL